MQAKENQSEVKEKLAKLKTPISFDNSFALLIEEQLSSILTHWVDLRIMLQAFMKRMNGLIKSVFA